MKILTKIILLTCLTILFAYAKGNNLPQHSEKQWQPGMLIVKMKSTAQSLRKNQFASELQTLQSKYSVYSIDRLITSTVKTKTIGREELERIFILKTDESTDILSLAQKIALEPSVEYAEPNYILQSHSVPNDPLLNQVYPLGIVHADSAWSIQKGDSTVIIGIIDTGVDWDHPDLAGSIWNNADEIPGNNIDDDGNGFIDDIRGWDFLENGINADLGEDSTTQDNNPMDFNGHGTHVAGIAAGSTNNGIGIASLSWGCKIMPLRIGWHTKTGSGVGNSADMAKAFVYAADNGASICNLSYGTSGAVLDGALYAFKNGVVIVNSAGNSNSDEVSLLGAQSWALSVASTNSEDKKSWYSSFNSSVDVSAPGGDSQSGNFLKFLSTIVNPSPFYGNNLYTSFEGTSMASPFVASLAGLVKSQHKNWSPAEIMFQIVETVDNIDSKNPSYAKKLGSGRINALRALTETVVAKPKLKFISVIIDDNTGGNGNGLLDPGETANINCTIRNEWGDAINLNADLSTANQNVSITKSTCSYGTLYGISHIDSSQQGSSDKGFTVNINANALPQTISFTITLTSTNGYSVQLPFDVKVSAKLLIVDDDDGSNNIEQYYYKALNRLGIVYDTWDRNTQGSLPVDYLQKYKVVVWLCEWAFPALDSSDRNVLTAYLNSGGSLFLSGQDIGWDLADSTGDEYLNSKGASKKFYETYLKTKYISDDAKNDGLLGIVGNSVSDNLAITRNQPGRSAPEQFPDVIDTINGSKYCFLYNGGSFIGKGGAVTYSKEYKLVHFTFGGFESITDSSKRNTIMERVIKFLSPDLIVSNIIDEAQSQQPFTFSLEQNYPNPFNPTTTIQFTVPLASKVILKVYDMLGREISMLINTEQQSGIYNIQFDASKLSSGIYFYRISSGSFTDIKKMMLIK
ncbi:MAG: S8 family serine peptidase [Bacteroidota bacterium]|nr:S8 family serine peptidase [Bacteroidota bacterium]